jgi:hypothetical protein
LEQHPENFMNDAHYYQRFESVGTGKVARFDNGYLDQHPNVARELSQNPALVDNHQYLINHPGLHDYLAAHPEMRAQLQLHPDRFMSAESRYEQSENGTLKPHPWKKWRAVTQ